MNGIATTYHGIRFRSRLEARWAAFFTNIGWRYEYEPFDLNGYIPDFLILGERPMLVEVGPCATRNDYLAKAAKATAVEKQVDHDVLVVGVSALPPLDHWAPSAGWLGQVDDWPTGDDFSGPANRGLAWDLALWHRCGACGAVAVHHAVQSYTGRPCGHGDGDHHLGQIDPTEIEVALGGCRQRHPVEEAAMIRTYPIRDPEHGEIVAVHRVPRLDNGKRDPDREPWWEGPDGKPGIKRLGLRVEDLPLFGAAAAHRWDLVWRIGSLIDAIHSLSEREVGA